MKVDRATMTNSLGPPCVNYYVYQLERQCLKDMQSKATFDDCYVDDISMLLKCVEQLEEIKL